MAARRSKHGFAYDPVTAIGIPNGPRGSYAVRGANGDPEHTFSWSLSKVAWSVDGAAATTNAWRPSAPRGSSTSKKGGDAD